MQPYTIAFNHHKYLGMLRHFSMKGPLRKAWIKKHKRGPALDFDEYFILFDYFYTWHST